MSAKYEIEAMVAELLAWAVYTYPKDAASWAADVGRLLDGFGLFEKGVWKEECQRWAAVRGDFFINPNPFGAEGDPPPSSPAL